VLETAALFGAPRPQALMAGAALECVHCYSLAHDDLPAMDNDDLRRGRPTLHRAFDQASAILAGDALLTFAFDLLARPGTHPDAAVRVALVAELARAAGLGGMVGGQMLDLAAEGRFSARPRASAKHPRESGDPAQDETAMQAALDPRLRGNERSEEQILTLQSMKTGALIRFACRAGAVLGGAPAAQLAALDAYGVALGQAFQIADDLLDVEGDPTALGKATGKDFAAGKATLVTLLGRAGAHARLDALMAEAVAALAPFGARAGVLAGAAVFVGNRLK
jgi:farnesyl diphosphate synthase